MIFYPFFIVSKLIDHFVVCKFPVAIILFCVTMASMHMYMYVCINIYTALTNLYFFMGYFRILTIILSTYSAINSCPTSPGSLGNHHTTRLPSFDVMARYASKLLSQQKEGRTTSESEAVRNY